MIARSVSSMRPAGAESEQRKSVSQATPVASSEPRVYFSGGIK